MSAWWDENHKLLLLTAEEFAALPDREVLTCIDGTIAVKGIDEIDDDTRGGHLAYGVTGAHPLRIAHLETMAARPKPEPFAPPTHNARSCKIGIIGDVDLPPGADAPMRNAVEQAFFELTGVHAQFNFSSWGTQLNSSEFDIVKEQLDGHA